jgi:seryl-tRNA synthetase
MLDLKFVSSNLGLIKEALKKRNMELDLTSFEELDKKRRELIVQVESMRHNQKESNEEIQRRRKKGEDVQGLIEELRAVSDRIKGLEQELKAVQERLEVILLDIPNIPDPSVPVGPDEGSNQVVRVWGQMPEFTFEARPHWEIGELLGILDIPRATKIAGSRFALLLGYGSKLERALINFMLDIHTKEHGYKEVWPPFMVNSQSMTGTGQLPKFREDLFKLESWDYYLIPTAEVPVTNIHREEILWEEDLPIKYVAYSPCFRAEAGSHGKDTRGIIRQHQFDKVELVKLVRPEDSMAELEGLTRDAEEILRRLGLHYRVVVLCTGDLGFSSSKTYDLEVWMPGQGVYREISSCSNFKDLQARRAEIRFKKRGRKGTQLVHTLNGSGLAVGRTLAAILENYQEADGSVVIPEALRPYMDGLERIAIKGN